MNTEMLQAEENLWGTYDVGYVQLAKLLRKR